MYLFILTLLFKAICLTIKKKSCSLHIQSKWNPIHTFALSAQIIPMDKLLESGFDIDSVDEVNIIDIQFLHFIIRNHSFLTWTYKSRLYFVNQDGFSALHKAIISRKDAVIGHLLRKGASPHIKDKVRTLFIYAASPVNFCVHKNHDPKCLFSW